MPTKDTRYAAQISEAGMQVAEIVTWHVMPPTGIRRDALYRVMQDPSGEWFVVGSTRHPLSAEESVHWFDFGGCLEEFAGLEDVSNHRAVEKFATRYGPLWLCSHETDRDPASLHFLWNERRRQLFAIPYRSLWECDECHFKQLPSDTPHEILIAPERLAVWGAAVNAVRAALLLAAALRQGHPTRAEWWSDLAWGHPGVPNERVEEYLPEHQWVTLSIAVNDWLDRGSHLSFIVVPEPDAARGFARNEEGNILPRGGVTLRRQGTLGAIAWQLAGVIASVKGSYVCERCELLHSRLRAPKQGQRMPVLCRNCKGQERARQARTQYALSHPEVRRRRKLE